MGGADMAPPQNKDDETVKPKDTVTLTLHVPKDLHRNFKSQCASVNKPMSHVLLAYIKALANEDVFPRKQS